MMSAIIEKTKPYGMKALIRYVINTQFNINMSFKASTELHSHIQLDFGENIPITYSTIPYQYHNRSHFQLRDQWQALPRGRGALWPAPKRAMPYGGTQVFLPRCQR